MKLVLTLLVRDEADILDANLAFHLNAGVDFVIATDHGSSDGTTEILERYARAGFLHVIREDRKDFPESEFITRMARMAASDFEADWVINGAADEFWWPRAETLTDVLSAVPPRYGIVRAALRNFVPRDGDADFAERMTLRLSLEAPINDPSSPWRPVTKVVHRGDPAVTVWRGSHHAERSDRLIALRGWYPIEVLHFGMRGADQYARKASAMNAAFDGLGAGAGTGYHRNAFRAVEEGAGGDYYRAHVVDDDDAERGLADDRLVIDTRVRDALRELRTAEGGLAGPNQHPLRLPAPGVVDDASYAVEVAVLDEADVVRLQRRVDQLEHRLVDLEQRLGPRLRRRLRSLRRAPSS